MPHIHLEYSANVPLDAGKVLQAVNAALFATGQFQLPQEIKSRAQAFEVFAVGDAMSNQGFVHLRVAVMAGRSLEVRNTLAEAALGALQAAHDWQALALQVQLAAEVQEIIAGTYVSGIVAGQLSA